MIAAWLDFAQNELELWQTVLDSPDCENERRPMIPMASVRAYTPKISRSPATERKMAKKKAPTQKTPAASRKPKKVAPSRKKPRPSTLPKQAAILLCDGVLTEAGSGKTVLQGVFDQFNVADPSKPVRPFFVYSKLYGGKGRLAFGIEVVAPDGSVILATGDGDDLDLEPDATVIGISRIAGLKLPSSGVYCLYQTVGKQRVGEPARLTAVVQQVNTDDADEE